MSKAVEYHKKGYNCAESVIKAVNDIKQQQIPVALGSPFGSGMGVGATCGAITGAMIAIVAMIGRDGADQHNEARACGRILMNKVKDAYGTYECRELKKQGVSCDEIIAFTEELLAKKGIINR